jgi:transcriptional regulator with GAF, ATPase, and Fis domain
MVTLHIGRILQHQNRLKEALDHLSRGIIMVEGLGDTDIMYQAAEFFGIYYYIQGLPNKAVGFFEKAIEARQDHDRLAANEILPVYLGNCAAFIGQFHRAIGILDAHWHRARLRSDHATARLMRAALGHVLLMTGRKAQALAHLNACIEEAETSNDIWATIWSRRALAYSFYLEGQMPQSYSLMQKYFKEASRHGMPRPFYALPWMLEVLFAYHHAGYAPIPDHHLDDEIDDALNGINIHLRGTARRLKAKQILIKDGNTDKAVFLLEASMEDMKLAHDPVGRAKVRAEMAICCLLKKDRNAARDLAFHAWENLSVFGFDHFPDPLKPLIKSHEIIAGSKTDNKDFLKRLIATLETIVPNADRISLLSELVSGIARSLEAERGGLFLLENRSKAHRPAFVAGYNLNRDMAESEPFRKSLMCVFKSFEKQQPVFKRDPNATSQKAILCLPITTAGGMQGVLYLAESYGNELFADFSDQTLDAITQYATKYVAWVENYCKQMEEKSLSTIKSASNDDSRAKDLRYTGPVMEGFVKRVDQIAATDAAVLIMGESGVGKELIAKRIHARSPRCDMPFIPVNLASISEGLMESELFGHERGAFTGADRQKQGRMTLAHKGTLFLDEIGEIPRSIQVKLLRVLQERNFMRVGGVTVLKSDFRLITATNRDLIKEVAEGRFREDLYYRLNVVPLIVPPLRERNDVLFLTESFLEEFSRKYHCRVPSLNDKDCARLNDYAWPGNVRELKNIVERAVIATLSGGHLEFSLSDGLAPNACEGQWRSFLGDDFPTLEEIERRYIKMVIEKTDGKIGGVGGAAELLGINRTTLYSRMKKLGLS